MPPRCRAPRCPRCGLLPALCVCADMPVLHLRTRLSLVQHLREFEKPSSTGSLLLAALVDAERHLRGDPREPLDMRPALDPARRPLLLFPSADARPLGAELLAEDPRPVELIVPDGNWSQARRIPRRVPGLEQVQAVVLPPGVPSRWGLRKAPRSQDLSTLEAVARAIGILESPDAQAALEDLLERVVTRTLRARGLCS